MMIPLMKPGCILHQTIINSVVRAMLFQSIVPFAPSETCLYLSGCSTAIYKARMRQLNNSGRIIERMLLVVEAPINARNDQIGGALALMHARRGMHKNANAVTIPPAM